MLINCRPGCKNKKVTTNGSLDLEQDEVICTYCNDVIPSSKFIKISLKNQGDILRQDNRKSFQFNCITCKKKVQTVSDGNNLIGINCQGKCEFNVSKFTIHAMNSIVPKVLIEESEVEEGSEE